MSKLMERLREHEACADGLAWAKHYRSASAAWLACERPDWMLWALDAAGLYDEHKGRQFMAWCARNTPLPDGRVCFDLLTDARSRAAVDIADRLASGEVIDEAARSAAWSAARSAARSAAWSAAESAARSAAWSAAESAAWSAAWSAQADQLRRIFGNPFASARKKVKRCG